MYYGRPALIRTQGPCRDVKCRHLGYTAGPLPCAGTSLFCSSTMPAKGKRSARRGRARNRDPKFADVGGIPRAVALSPILGQTYRMQRTLGIGLPKSAADQGVQLLFALADVPSSTEFSNLFQEWRLDSVHCHFIWVPATTTGPTPRFTFALNPSATAAPATEAAILQMRHTIWTTSPTSRDYCIKIKPRVTAIMGTSAATSGALTNAVAPHGQFMSTIAPTTQYGSLLIWGAFFNTGLASAGELNAQLTYNFVFRGMR